GDDVAELRFALRVAVHGLEPEPEIGRVGPGQRRPPAPPAGGGQADELDGGDGPEPGSDGHGGGGPSGPGATHGSGLTDRVSPIGSHRARPRQPTAPAPTRGPDGPSPTGRTRVPTEKSNRARSSTSRW